MTAFFKFHSALRARHVLGPKPKVKEVEFSNLVYAQDFYPGIYSERHLCYCQLNSCNITACPICIRLIQKS